MRLHQSFRTGIPIVFGFILFFVLLAAPLRPASPPKGKPPRPRFNPRSTPRGTPLPARPKEPANAFPKITEKERAFFYADPSYVRRFSYPLSSLKVKVWVNKRVPRFDPLEQLDKDRRDRLELKPRLPKPETEYDPVRGVLPEPKPTPFFSL